MRLAIVILNWNGLKLLQRFIPGVVENSHGYQVYVADNASTDASVDWLKEFYGNQVKIIQNEDNLGFAGGYNEALKHVEEEIVCLLNSDVQVTPGWCKALLVAFTEQENLVAAQPKIKDLNHTNRFEYAGASGGYLDQLGYPYCRGRIFNYIEVDKGQYNNPVSVDWASGAALFIRRQVFIEAGGFDKNYFAHQEEIDLCWRLRRLGYDIQVVPDSTVYHLGGGTLDSLSPRKTFLNFRNSLFTVIKNDTRSIYIGIILSRMILDGLAAMVFLFQGKISHFTAIFKAHISFYRQLPFYIRQRKKLKSEGYHTAKNKGVCSIVWSFYVLQRRRFNVLLNL